MPELTGTLTQLYTYPIKSCAGVAVSQALVTPNGLAFDRQWMIVDDQGEFQTQRHIPHLVWIEPEVQEQAQTLTISAPEMPTLTLPLVKADAPKLTVRVWADRLDALDMGQAAAKWLDDYLQVPGKHFRLVQFDRNHTRLSDGFWCGAQPAPVQFADGFALNILSEASLRHFNERRMEMGQEPVDARRFRPNLVIDGLGTHEEDLLHTMQFKGNGASLLLELVKPCPRCQIPDVNPDTAAREPEVSTLLARYRQMPAMDHAVCFAMNTVVRSQAAVSLRVQDTFEGTYRFEG